jgi:hypothetical protein
MRKGDVLDRRGQLRIGFRSFCRSSNLSLDPSDSSHLVSVSLHNKLSDGHRALEAYGWLQINGIRGIRRIGNLGKSHR